ncbi:glycosyltransferase [Clostridium sp.]|uniref:glycosyltransferase n=1 Tax=Clostridium sp. TaxID=1506 RepID=UPI0032165320
MVSDNIVNVKKRIENLINNNYCNEAIKVLKELIISLPEDLDIYSMYTVALSMVGRFEEAIDICKKGLEIEFNNFDLNYNLAYIYESMGEYSKALSLYNTSITYCNDEKLIESIKEITKNIHYTRKVNEFNKIIVFVKKDMDSFLGDIINGLEKEFIVVKVVVNNYNQIDLGMEWADICWFEWCDELIEYGSRHRLAEEKKLICRLHSYEAFTNYILNINWDNVDKIIFVAHHIKEHALSKIDIDLSKVEVIHNGVDVNKYNLIERNPGFNIAYVGYINYKKGPMLLLHTFKAIYDKDNRYKLHIAGDFQDERYILYFDQKIKEFGLENNVIYHGWQDNISKWLEDKNYIICTSVLEGNPVGLMEAMSRGIKPIIHSFVGAKQLYPEEYIWDTIDEAVNIVLKDDYDSNKYRSYIEKNFSIELQLEKIKKVIESMILKKNIDDSYIKGINAINFHSYLSGDKFSSGLKVYVENNNMKIVDRISYLVEVCKNKNVIHLGCADHLELIDSKRQNNLWLHDLLTNVSQKCIGFDINEEAIDYINKELKISNVFYENIISKKCDMICNSNWDIMVIGEILEHVNNPVEFLSKIKTLYKGSLQKLVITVPNALRLENYIFSQSGYECINSDHRYWFTPYTISKVVYESGLKVEEIFMTTGYKVEDENIKNVLMKNNILMDTIAVIVKL